MEKKKHYCSREIVTELIFLVSIFVFIFLWAVIAPFNASPDESMRYDIVNFIVQNGRLPDGRDPSIRHEIWGISYAFNPITPYIVGAWFINFVQLFTDHFDVTLMAARMVNIILGTLTAFLTLKIGKRLFSKEAAYFMAVLVAFLPGAVFIHSYINTDSMALFASTWIILCWVRGMQDGWSNRLCVELALALGVCTLSYYNAYGYLLLSALFFAGIFCKCQEKQWDYKPMLKKGFLILGIVFLVAGWWFIRSAILYDGDFLGMKTSSMCAEMYAKEAYKPSNRETPQSLGMSLPGMLFWIPSDEWHFNYMGTVAASFIGTFGFMDIFMPENWTKAYWTVLFIGAVGVLWNWKCFFRVAVRRVSKQTIKEEGNKRIIITFIKDKVWNKENWLRVNLLFAGLIPCFLLLYYAYASDFQAQGRYLMPGCIPLMYFITLGFDTILKKVVKNETIRKWIFHILSVTWVVSSVLVYQLVYAVNY